MLKSVAVFFSWVLFSLFVAVGIASMFSRPLFAFVMFIWGLLVFPPLYKITAKFGRGWNIAGRLIPFFISPIIASSEVEKSPSPKPSPTVEVSPSPKVTKSPLPNVKASSSPAVTKSNQPSSVPSPTLGVTMANFDQLKTGMNYEQVVTILGKSGKEMSSSEIGGIKTVMYTWEGDNGGFGANMNAMFQNNKLISKAQFGLK
jgi:Domain of Unknown Function with PDB structure (DUF3862)